VQLTTPNRSPAGLEGRNSQASWSILTPAR